MSLAWERGVNSANAQALGQLKGKHREQIEGLIEGLGNEIGRQQAKLQTYQTFLEKKSKSKDADEALEIFGAVRPDLIPKDATIGAKRVANLRLLAWGEWWQHIVYGYADIAEAKIPVLRGLSDGLQKTGQIENPELAVSALNEIADRMELAIPMENGADWVDNRIEQMAKTVQFLENDITIPDVETIEQVIPHLIESKKRKGHAFNPFESNSYGIKNMAVR